MSKKIVGEDVVETQRRMAEEAHRRASRDEEQSEVAGVEGDAITEDRAPYSEAERASAAEHSGPLNWNNGELTMSPAYVPSSPFHALHPVTEHTGGALSGVEAIIGHVTEGR